MTKGYTGQLLLVDLTTGDIQIENPGEDLCRQYIGGLGLGARFLYERMKPGADPLGPDNILGFITGPLTGTGVYGGGRYTVVAKSPQTQAWADSNSGGTWGPELKAAGYDGVFFVGASPKPVYLAIDHGRAEVRDAQDLWGRDTFDTDAALQDELGGSAPWKVACIGPVGERLSPLAGIVNERGRIAARSGVGAVMGSKNLKAVAVRGRRNARVEIADRERLRLVQKDYRRELRENPFMRGLTEAGTGGGTSFLLSIGDCPTRNWIATGADSMPTSERLDSTNMDQYKLRSYGCHSCPVRCGALVELRGGTFATDGEQHRPEYETLAAFGSLCLNDSVESIIKANEICNRFGMDTISAGATVAFAMECFERGVITTDDTDGLELTWGDSAAVVALTEKIARSDGFGALLSSGVKEAAARIGRGTDEYAMHVGGREVPYHDPRMSPAKGSFYILDAQPTNHMAPMGQGLLESRIPLGSDPFLQPNDLEVFGDYDHKGEMLAVGAAYSQLLSSSGLCALYAVAMAPPVVELLQPVTGWDMNWREGIVIGKRINTLRQAFNFREGITPDDFKLPKRLETPLEVGPAAGKTIPFETLRRRYFEAMGWDADTGQPLPQTMRDLSLDFS